MIRRNTWILLVVLAGLVGFSFYLRDLKAKETAQATTTLGSRTLFTAAEGEPTDIKIGSGIGNSVEIGRDSAGKWVLKAPTQADADQASAEAAASQVGALEVLSDVHLGPDIVGLDKPAYTITVAYGAAKPHTLLVGSVTPIQDGYYTQLDGGQFQVVDKGGLDALLDLLTQPPYLATQTPTASATATPGPVLATPTTESNPVASAQPGMATSTP